MADPAHDGGVKLELGNEEEWVLHAAALHYLDRQADGDVAAPDREDRTSEVVDLLDALEAAEPLCLDDDSLRLVRAVLSEYLAGAPLRDRATCRSVLAEVRDSL